MPETNETTAVDRYPENYVEKFPGLDTYSWLYGGKIPSARGRRFHDSMKHESYRYDRKLLIEFERGGSLWAIGPEFSEAILPAVKAHRSESYLFQKEKQINSLDEASADIPVCVVNADLDRMPAPEALPINSESWHFGLHAFIDSAEILTSQYPGYRGVRTNFIRDYDSGHRRWIKSIDCIVKVSAANPDASWTLELVHFNATIGVPAMYGTPERLKEAIGWKSFEELFPGHRLNE